MKKPKGSISYRIELYCDKDPWFIHSIQFDGRKNKAPSEAMLIAKDMKNYVDWNTREGYNFYLVDAFPTHLDNYIEKMKKK